MKLFEKIKFKNKNNVAKYREQYINKKISIDKLLKDVLFELLECAVQKIDELKNGIEEVYERNWKESAVEIEFIIDDLFGKIEERIKLDIYK